MIILTQDFHMALSYVDEVRKYDTQVVCLRPGLMFTVRFCKLKRNYSFCFKFRWIRQAI